MAPSPPLPAFLRLEPALIYRFVGVHQSQGTPEAVRWRCKADRGNGLKHLAVKWFDRSGCSDSADRVGARCLVWHAFVGTVCDVFTPGTRRPICTPSLSTSMSRSHVCAHVAFPLSVFGIAACTSGVCVFASTTSLRNDPREEIGVGRVRSGECQQQTPWSAFVLPALGSVRLARRRTRRSSGPSRGVRFSTPSRRPTSS